MSLCPYLCITVIVPINIDLRRTKLPEIVATMIHCRSAPLRRSQQSTTLSRHRKLPIENRSYAGLWTITRCKWMSNSNSWRAHTSSYSACAFMNINGYTKQLADTENKLYYMHFYFGTCLWSNCWDRIPRTCHVLLDFSPRIPLGTFSILHLKVNDSHIHGMFIQTRFNKNKSHIYLMFQRYIYNYVHFRLRCLDSVCHSEQQRRRFFVFF